VKQAAEQMAKPTPGPWETDGLTIEAPAGIGSDMRVKLATLSHFVPQPERQANARLMAASQAIADRAMFFTMLVEGHLQDDSRETGVTLERLTEALYALRAQIADATGERVEVAA